MKLLYKFMVFAVLLLSVGLQTNVQAMPLTFSLQGLTNPDLQADVIFEYVSSTGTTGTINIDIKNTSLAGGGPDPLITAFALNVPSNVTGVSNFTGPSGWSPAFSLNGINAPQLSGMFDLAGITGPNFNGGDPKDGIPRSSTFSFSFLLTGSGLGTLNNADFLNLFTTTKKGDPGETTFAARFQRTGLDGKGSDVAVPGGMSQSPEPSSLILLGCGLLLAGGVARFRRKQK